MKKNLFFIVLFCFFCTLAQGQTPKFGHINVEELVNLMPERDSAIVSMQKYRDELEETYVGIRNELQQKAAEYQQKQATWSALIRETKETEINQLSSRLQQFEQDAPANMEQMQNILYGPVYAKANEAIQKVGKEMGLIYVFNSSGIPYIDVTQSINILDKVKAALKIPAEKVAPTQIGQAAR